MLTGRDLFTHAYCGKQLRNGRNLIRAKLKHLVYSTAPQQPENSTTLQLPEISRLEL